MLLETLAPLSPDRHFLLWWELDGTGAHRGLAQSFRAKGFCVQTWNASNKHASKMFALLLARGDHPGEAFAFWDGEDAFTQSRLSGLKRLGLKMHVTYPDPLIALGRVQNSFL